MEKTKLPRQPKTDDSHHFHLAIPTPLWLRMIEEGAAAWGITTKFILEAITEKLNREKEQA